MTNNPRLSNSTGDEGVHYFYQDMIENESPMAKTMASEGLLGYSPITPTTTSSMMGGVGASSKGGELKPNRRRLRASKKTPTTVLKANTKNFRALVQQFTGCPTTTTTTSISFATRNGPVDLSFGPNTYVGQVSTAITTTTSSSPSFLPNYGYSNNTYSSSNQIIGQQPQIQFQQSMFQTGDQDHGFVSVNHNYDGNIIATNNDDFSTNSIELQGRIGGVGSGDYYYNNTLFP